MPNLAARLERYVLLSFRPFPTESPPRSHGGPPGNGLDVHRVRLTAAAER
jgi:hypothetical protein